MATHRIPQGPLPTGSIEALVIRVTPSEKLADLSTVTSGLFEVRLPDGTEVTWTPTIQNQSANSLDLVYVYATNDIDTPGPYVVHATLYVGLVPYRLDRHPTVFDVTDD